MGTVRLQQNRHLLFMIYYVSLKPIKSEIRPSPSQMRGQHFKFLAVAHSECYNKASSIPLFHIVLMDGTVPVAMRSFQMETRDITAIHQTNVSCWAVPQLHNQFPVIWQAHHRISLSGFLPRSHVACSHCIPVKDFCCSRDSTSSFSHTQDTKHILYLMWPSSILQTHLKNLVSGQVTSDWQLYFFLSLLFRSQLSKESFHCIPHPL